MIRNMEMELSRCCVISDPETFYDQEDYQDCFRFQVAAMGQRFAPNGGTKTYKQKFMCFVLGEMLDHFEEILDKITKGTSLKVYGYQYMVWTPGSHTPPCLNLQVSDIELI